MIPKHALKAIDKLLQDVCNNKFPLVEKFDSNLPFTINRRLIVCF